jgi:RHS repeat-associated protein
MLKGLKLVASHFWLSRRMSGRRARVVAAVSAIIFLVGLFTALSIAHNGIYQIGLRLISPRALAAAPVVALGFNEGSGATTADASGNNNTGTLVGGVTWTTAGKYGKALSFNGSSGVVRIPDSPSWKVDGLTGYAMSMWVKVKDVSGDYRVALGKGEWPSGDIVIYKYENTWSYGIRTTDWSCGGSTTALPYLTTVDNTYHHIAVSMNASASRCHFYADGQIVHTDEFVSGTTVFATGAGLNNLYIGGLDGSHYLNADIDEVRIYTTSLTQAEIQTDMNTPIGGGAGDTTPPVISGVAAGSIATTSATINWTTNENADSQVEYGLTTAYGQATTLNPALVTAHSQGLSSLTAGRLYHYRVKSKDAAGNLAVSGDFTFTTATAGETTPPVISGVTAGSITTTSATITWTTNENSDSQVEYGLTTAYGQSTTLNPALATAHLQGLSGLTAGTVYHYRVKSRDAAGNLAVSADFSFTTAQGTPVPLTKLKEYVYAGGRMLTSEEKSCVPALSPAGASLPQGGGTGSVSVSTPTECSWAATSSAGWITITSASSGAGSGTVSYSVTANSGPQRSGTISISGQAFTITQAPHPSSCSYALNKTSESISEQEGSGSLTLTTGGGCPWTAASNAGWLTISSATSGNGPATITYSVAANPVGQRVGVITVGGQTLTVTQAPNQASCSFALNPSGWSYPFEGGSGSFSVTTGAGCHWDAATTVGWITITGGATGVGNGTVGFTVQANNGGSRTGTISVRGQVFTITQAPNPASCVYEVSPAFARYNEFGGFGVVMVSTGAGCPWSAGSSDGWITITSGGSGSGPGTVGYEVPPYSEIRYGHINVADRSVLVEQIPQIILPGPDEKLTALDTSTDGQPRGLTARYFGNTTLSGQPALKRTDAAISFTWVGKSPDKALPADRFSVRWDGQLAAPTSEAYTFYLFSDGGARLWVNNQLVIDRWQPPFEPQTRSTPVELKADEKADIRAEYYNTGGKAAIHLLWSSASTPKQIIPRQHLYPEAATNQSPADANKQTGMLLPPGSDAGPKITRPQLGATSRWLASPLSRAGLALLIACGVLALLLRIDWRQARRQFAASAAGVARRLRDQLASRLGELFRISAAVSDKLQFVVGSGKKLLAGISDKLNVASFGKRLLEWTCEELKFVRHFLAALLPIFKVVSYCDAAMRIGGQKLAGLAPERVRIIAGRALSLWRGSVVARLKPVLRRALVIALVVRLAAPLTPAEAEGLVRAAQTTWREARAYAAYVGATVKRSIKMPSGRRLAKVVSAASQAEQVTDLQVCPRQLVMFVGERYTLTPVALNSNQKVVHGVGMRWTSFGANIADVSSFGQVEAMAVGNTAVEVQCGNASKQIPIEVRIGMRPTGSNQEADIDPTNDCAAEQSSAFAPQSAAVPDAQPNLIGVDGVSLDWDPTPLANSLATHFRNAVGAPRFSATSLGGAGVPTSAQLGSSSYRFNVPVVSVGGRGVGASVDMELNSRVWNNDNGKLTFNYIGAYPAPGWTMGYGKIIRNYNATATGNGSGIGSGNNPGDYLLVTGNGTRIRLAARYEAATDRWLHEADNGSFLQFNPISGEMRYQGGSRMIYSSVNGALLPTAMINSNGAAITMTYRDYCEGTGCLRVFRHRTALSAIRDTLGRYVTFHYYGDNDYPVNAANGRPAGELAAIKAPDMNGVQQEVIRVEYQPIILKYNFGSMIVDAPANNSQIQVLRRIYYPQTGKGFLFLDYSSYGMPRKISRRMAMTGAGGAITDGTETAYTTYNYITIDPSDPYGRNQVGSLSDFPQFTRREEWRLGQTDANGAPTTVPTRYDYLRTTDGSKEIVTIKYVDKNCEEVTTTGTDSSQPSSGKPVSVELKNSATGAVLSKQVYTYMTGPDGEVEIEEVETIDEAGQGRLVKVSYGDYGRVTDRYEYGYKQAGSYQIRRRTHYDYIDDQIYLAARFLHLVSRVSIYDAKDNNDDADDELKAKTETVYDDYAAMGEMQSYGLNPSLYPPNHDATYDQNKLTRGNATAVKTFSKIVPEEATTRRVRFDIFGNIVEAEASCCMKKIFSFSGATAYSQPDSIRVGGATGLSLETTYQYNYFTGLVDNETNPDGLLTSYEYDTALRLKRVTLPTDAVAVTQFERDSNGNDLLSYVSQTSYDDHGSLRVITGKQWFDGSGRVIRAGTGAGDDPDSYDMTATIYDGWGRVVKQSNPYLGDANGNPQGGAQFWTVNTYDELSRVIRATLADNQTIQATYSGATATSGATVINTDTVGRKRKNEVDGLGRLVKVTEQNPANGNLEWETSYSYDALDNLTQVNQGGQLRSFTYDAKGRLTSEILPEAGTTTYTYTDFDAVSTSTDARGVVTTFTYGPLNMMTGVSYNTASATGVAATAAVSVTFKSAAPGKGQIEAMTDGSGSESYGYDNFGRLQSSIRVIDGVSYEKQYEYNAAGQMTLMTYPSGKRVKMESDARGRLSALQRVDASGNVQEAYLSEINYRVDGLISSQKLGNETTEGFSYSNDRLQLTSQMVTKGGNTLLSLSYGYGSSAGQMGSGTTPGNSGQLVSVNGTINGQGRNQEFTYDNVGRIVTATGWGAWARRFGYDRHGNKTAVWDAVNGGSQLQNTVIGQVAGIKTNRIASVNGIAFSYDASGNVTGDGARAYTYDAKNRIVSVSGLSSESYSYDAGNRRVKKEAGGVVTHYIWEGGQVIAEYERGGGATPATGTRYYHQDRLSTRIITDSAGGVVGTMDQLPFGEEVGGSGEREKHKFTTYERDQTGLDYAVNRFYSPQQGRFTQVDPIGMGAVELTDPQTLNLYAYSRNDPVNFRDPTGLNLERFDTNCRGPFGIDFGIPGEFAPDWESFGFDCGGGGGGGGGFDSGGGGGGGGGGPFEPDPVYPAPPEPPDEEAARKALEDCYNKVDRDFYGKLPAASVIFENTEIATLVSYTGFGKDIYKKILKDQVDDRAKGLVGIPSIRATLWSGIKDFFKAPFKPSFWIWDVGVINYNMLSKFIPKMREAYDFRINERAKCRERVNSEYGTNFGMTREDELIREQTRATFGGGGGPFN